MADKIRALFIFEILGRPPEHLKLALESFIEKLGNEKGVEVVEKKINEPHKLEGEKAKKIVGDWFITFTEVEVIIDNLNLLLNIILNSLPSSVEILEPSELRLKNFDLSSLLSDLTTKLHRYDEIAKASLMDNKQLATELEKAQKRLRELERDNKDNSKTDTNNLIKDKQKAKSKKTDDKTST